MSSGQLPIVAEKLDIRKYYLVVRRRKWWGIIPFVLLVAVFGVACLAMPPKYHSTCIIWASKSEVAEILSGRPSRKPRASVDIVKANMLSYGYVMQALAGSQIMREEVEDKAKGDVARRSRLEEALLARIVKNTRVRAMGGGRLIQVSHFAYSTESAFSVLNRLVTYFVENALANERNNAKRAKDLLWAECKRYRDELESLDAGIVRFQQEHPAVTLRGPGSVPEMYRDVRGQLRAISREIDGKRRQLQRIIEQIAEMPKQKIERVESRENPAVIVYRTRLVELRSQLAMALKRFTPLHPTVKALRDEVAVTEQELAAAETETGEDNVVLTVNKEREEREKTKLDLEAELEYLTEKQRKLQLEKNTLEEEVAALPALYRELAQRKRAREAVSDRYSTALERYKKHEAEYNIKMEGLVTFRVHSPPRRSHAKNRRHIYKLALMGLFVALAAGVGAIAGTEFLDQSFTDIEGARDFLRLPSLGVIPLITTATDRRRRIIRTTVIVSSVLVLISAVVLSVLYVDPVRKAASDLWAWIEDQVRS